MIIDKPKTLKNNFIEKIKSILHRIYFEVFEKRKYENLNIGGNVKLNRATKFEEHSVIYHNVNIASSFIGRGTYISDYTSLPFSHIGRYCQIGKHVKVIIGDHPLGNNISTHPAFYSTLNQAGFRFTKETTFLSSKSIENSRYVVKIGNDVWIGDGVQILNGITIGNGAVLATGSVVTKDVAPYTIVGGGTSKVYKVKVF